MAVLILPYNDSLVGFGVVSRVVYAYGMVCMHMGVVCLHLSRGLCVCIWSCVCIHNCILEVCVCI